MYNHYDYTILGGGIIGLLTAQQLIDAGATVQVIEKNTFGQESSWAGGGILLPLYPWRQADAITQLVLQSLRLYPQLAERLLEATGLDPEWMPCGLLITQNPDIADAVAWCSRHQIVFSSASPELLGSLQTKPLNPLWLPEIANARNPRLLKSLLSYLRKRGVSLVEHCEVINVDRQGIKVNALQTTLGRIAVNELVIAGGAWSRQLFQFLFGAAVENLPKIAPVKGQMLLYQAAPELLLHIVLEGDRYLIPRKDGHILAGSTVEHDEFNKTTTEQARLELNEFALNLLPALANYPLTKHWAGLRPGTEEGVPYIGRHPELTNVSINAGHFRNGLVMGPASAELLSDLLLGRPCKVAPEPYQFTSH